jgi:N-acetylglutamate synthase-like GNAT family acetyltransferase
LSTSISNSPVQGMSTFYKMATMKIRSAKIADAQAVVDLINANFSVNDFPNHPRFSRRNEVEALMSKGRFLLAEENNLLVACAYVEPRQEASRLELLAVAPQHRRTGIGSQLLEAVEQLSRMMQCSFIHVRVMNLSRDLLSFCRRRGYVEFELEPLSLDAPFSPHCHLVKMCKQLDKCVRGF